MSTHSNSYSNKTKELPLWIVHLLMFFATVVVSSSFTVGAAIAHGLDPAVLLLVRYILAVLFLAPFFIGKYKFSCPNLRQLGGFIF